MKRLLYTLLCLLAYSNAYAQSSPIGPNLALRQSSGMGEDVRALGDEARVNVTIYTSDADALVRAGVDVQARFGGFVTARLHPNDLSRVAALPGVRQIEDPLVYPENDAAAALVGVTALRAGLFGGTSYTGAGVFVCVIDSGIDWDHLDFRDPADPSQTRIHAIWDQTLTAQAGEAPPAGFSYGVEYTEADIEAALAGGTPLHTIDRQGHGTHVAGTAAGNGASLSPARHVGMAPEARLVVVKGGDVSFSQSNLLNGLRYCDAVAKAAGKPVVVNLSLGADDGPHDGSDPKSLVIDSLAALPGRVVVQSAGNSGGAPIHRSGTLPANGSLTLTFTVPTYTPAAGINNDNFGFDVWFDATPGVTATLTSPNGHVTTQPANGLKTVATPDGAVFTYNYPDGYNGDRRIYFTLYDSDAAVPPAAGVWTLQLTSASGSAEGFHVWLFDNEIGGLGIAMSGADSDYTISNAAAGGITVGAYVHRWRYFDQFSSGRTYTGTERSDGLSSFSSRGPTRSGLTMPHLAAPGQAMVSTRSTDAVVASTSVVAGGRHYASQGTSMSSPVVAGLVALLLQHSPTLTGPAARQLLQDAADADASTGVVPNQAFGAGKVNAYTAMARLVGSLGTPGMQVRAYDGFATGEASIASGQAVAVRFGHTLGHDAQVRGVLVHPSQTLPGGTFRFTLHADAGAGTPGAQIGSPVDVAASSLTPFTWNHVDLTAAAATLPPATDYYIVVRAMSTSGSAFFRHDGASTTSRSLKEVGGTWSTQAFDWSVRPIVTSTATNLPVELVQFEAVRAEQGALLSWITASETNNAGFHVEARGVSEAQAWQELGFVAGRGTTAEASHYRFATEPLAPGRHAFRLKQVDTDGAFTYSGLVEIAVEVDHLLALYSDGPNPSAGSVQVRFTVPRRAEARVEAYDALGRRVAVLFSGEAEPGQLYRQALDGLASGVYVVRIVQGGQQQALPVVIAR